MGKARCGASLLAGMMLLAVLGGCAGAAAGFLVGGSVQEQVMEAEREQTFDTSFSNWVNNADAKGESEAVLQEPDPAIFAGAGLIAVLAAAAMAAVGISGVMRREPLAMSGV